ncbi:MAG: CoA pyrophosphatase [Parvibaculum sp.]|uniref:NUDIX hydrolase n=1 Tax=Parvibaculum sp. TaxID=2024848 RepID=UPI003C75D25B
MSHIFNANLRDDVARRLGSFELAPPPPGTLKRAAVAITIVPHGNSAAFLLTRRAPRLNAHGGQWALPGGRIDGNETPVEAALRELEEEISLRATSSAVLGTLDDYPTRSGYLITPVVVWADNLEGMKPNPGEVASIHPFALDELVRPDSPVFLTIPESAKPVIRILLGEKDHVHAPTAAVLYQFGEVALRGRATRVADLEQPVWAWK